MLQLILPNDNIESASIKVRWCLDDGELDLLNSQQNTPYIAIKISYDGRSYERDGHYLYPLSQCVAYLPLRYPGKCTITATVVTAEDDNVAAITENYQSYGYANMLFVPWTGENVRNPKFRRGTNRPTTVMVTAYDMSDEYEFNVPESVFGKEWPSWVKFCVNRYWYENKPKDQCGQRRRAMLFPFTTMVPLIIETIGRVAYNIIALFILLLVGVYGSVWRYIFHPFDWTVSWNMSGKKFLLGELSNKYWKDANPNVDMVLSLLLIPLTIPIVLIVVEWVWLMSTKVTFATLLYKLLIGVGIYYGVVVASICMVSLIGLVITMITNASEDNNLLYKLLDRSLDLVDRILLKLFGYDEKRILTMREKELLTCPLSNDGCITQLKAKDKSWKLLFAETKNKVCKPMRG